MTERHQDKPTITLKAGKTHRAVDQAGKLLRSQCEKRRIFQRGGELVRVFCPPKYHADRFLRRPKGTIQLEPLSPMALTEAFNRIAIWIRQSDGRRVDCPPKIAHFYLSRTGKWWVPVLAGIISAPILREDGTILQRPGYDRKTNLLLCKGDWPRILQSPTARDARDALQTLLEPFEEFPWVTKADQIVHLACILTAVQRRLLKASPIFGYTAPAQRSGKSLLAECVGIIATGTPPPATTISGEHEEIRKSITSALREGHQLTNLDNVADGQPLSSPDLAKAITQSEYRDRLLGTNRMLSLSTNVLWMATGNNLSFRGDLSVRALLCSIDAGMENPETREFKIQNLPEYVKNMRQQLVVAALTILRAYHVAGCPRQRVTAWGGFEDWSARIREPLVWLGLPDPCATRVAVMEADPEREESLAALHVLHRFFGPEPFTSRRIIRKYHSDRALKAALLAVAKEDDPRSLGLWLKRMRGRVLGGLRLDHQSGLTGGAARWVIEEQKGSQVGGGGQSRRVYRFPRTR